MLTMAANQSDGALLTNLQKIFTLCSKHGEEKLATDFIISIPNSFPLKNKEKRKKGKTWKCRKCKRIYKTNGGYLRHKVTCKKEKIKQKPKERKNAKRQPNLCRLCNRKSNLIKYHYSKFHKLSYASWKNKLSDKDSLISTICPECDDDYGNKRSLNLHYREYHKIKISLLLKEQNQSFRLINAGKRKTATVREKASVGDRDAVDDNHNLQEESDTEPVSEEELTENSNVQEEERVHGQRLCLECNEYQQASSFESHRAFHERRRETHEFTTNNTQNATNRHEENSRQLHQETVDKITLLKQGDKYVVISHSNPNAADQTTTRKDTNQNEVQSQTRDSLETTGNRATEANCAQNNVKESQEIPAPKDKRRRSHESRKSNIANTEKSARKQPTEISEQILSDNNVSQSQRRANNELRTNSDIFRVENDVRKPSNEISTRNESVPQDDINESQNRRRARKEPQRAIDFAQVENEVRKPSNGRSSQIQASVPHGDNKDTNASNELRRKSDIRQVKKDIRKPCNEMSARIQTSASQDNNKNINLTQNKILSNNELLRNSSVLNTEEGVRNNMNKVDPNEFQRNAENIEKEARKRLAAMSKQLPANASIGHAKNLQNKITANVSQENATNIKTEVNVTNLRAEFSRQNSENIKKEAKKCLAPMSKQIQANVSKVKSENDQNKIPANTSRENCTSVKIEDSERNSHAKFSGRYQASVSQALNKDIYIPQNRIRASELSRNNSVVKMEEEIRKPRAKLLWTTYYKKMKLETDEMLKQELFAEYLFLYSPLARMHSVCHRLMSQASMDKKPDAVSTVAPKVRSDEVTNRPFGYLKIPKYE